MAVAVWMGIGAPAGWAADYQLITSVTGKYEYNDNLRLNTDNELSDSIYTVTPKVAWIHDGERLDLEADASVSFYDYADYDVFDDTDQSYNAALKYTLSERWQLSFDGHVSEDNRPDRDIEETGLVLSSTQRNRFGGGGGATYMLSELTAVGFNVSANREDFDDPEESDRMDYHAVLFVIRSLDAWFKRTTGRLNLGYSHYAFDRDYDVTGISPVFYDTYSDAYDVDYYSLTAGTESDLTEKWTLSIDLGGRYAASERNVDLRRTYTIPTPTEYVQLADEDSDNWGFVGTLEVEYRGELSRAALLVSHDLQPTSSESGTANRTTVRLSGSRRLLEQLRGNLAFSWFLNKSDADDDTQDDIDTMSWNAHCGLTWAFNDYFSLSGQYTYTIYEDRDDDETAYRNRLLLQLTAQYDWLK